MLIFVETSQQEFSVYMKFWESVKIERRVMANNELKTIRDVIAIIIMIIVCLAQTNYVSPFV